ncbi:MAG TPA: type II toxin-antitoxin system HicA family toxin [Accumulibacter sp.]|uniref:type II toxin-antitoxin system HicA family toxin n=1 Tax=Accumulibacter sp. TaxID=2053492 RepID=UPI0025E169B1|nr:type II toxin-antitoxin system HicA family toxin [Accumulibacter sp.]MCM8598943.1 type II toxin-antitoxin system HicA family toxin [Accumulibacter sp.]MCM8662366.1 type II toxin-antitoxin system HicA family toxin [Accumulibacter sp.]HNC52338.1 type II toxin-antitoxin system HicA family toxin [Accumulibacter sp.]
MVEPWPAGCDARVNLARAGRSHHPFEHPSRPGLVTVKHPDSDLLAGTLQSVLEQAGWKQEAGALSFAPAYE